MTELVFWIGAIVVFSVPITVLIHLRRRFELDTLWYGLTAVGFVAGIGALLGRDVAFRVYATLLGLPAEMDRDVFFTGPHGLIFLPLATGLVTELIKSYGVWIFHTDLTRTRWPLYAVSVGVGAGLLSASMVLFSTAWAYLSGQSVLEVIEPWTFLKLLADIGFSAGLCSIALYWAASKRRVFGWTMAGLIHAFFAFLGIWTAYTLGFDAGWMSALITVVGCMTAATVLWGMNKRLGWPM